MIDLEQYIKNQLENCEIENIVSSEVKNQVREEIQRSLGKLVRNHVDVIIKSEIDIVMSGRVKTDDGWGKKAEFESFKDLFKSIFAKRLSDQWDMKKMVSKAIDDKVCRLMHKEYKAVTQKLIDSLCKTLDTPTE